MLHCPLKDVEQPGICPDCGAHVKYGEGIPDKICGTRYSGECPNCKAHWLEIYCEENK